MSTTTTTTLERPRLNSSTSYSYAFNNQAKLQRPTLPKRSHTANVAPRRPALSRTSSAQSGKGWYDTTNNPTLDDIAARLKTTISRIEQYQGRCAQNVVMALMRPTPVALFVFNPISLMIWAVLLLWWFGMWGQVVHSARFARTKDTPHEIWMNMVRP